MNVDSIINSHFKIYDGSIIIEDVDLIELSKNHQTPMFVYSVGVIRKKLARLRSALPDFEVFYSVKSNPNAKIVDTLLSENCGLEIASIGELNLALASGCEPARILFAGPGKSNLELEHAIQNNIGEIHVESTNEMRRISLIAEQLNKTPAISIRVNLSEAAVGGAMQMGGKPTAFGIDEEKIDDALKYLSNFPCLKLSGFHFYTGTQILSAEGLARTYEHAIALAIRLTTEHSLKLSSLDFGGGLGIPYFENETELDIEKTGHLIRSKIENLKNTAGLENCRLIIEPGRYLVAESGIYITSVIDVKESRGVNFVILNGGMHHHLAASGNLGQVIKRNFPMACINKLDTEKTFTADLVGPLCTPLDTLGRKVLLPLIEAEDTIAFFQSGAYALSASPTGFLSHPKPTELLVDGDAVTVI